MNAEYAIIDTYFWCDLFQILGAPVFSDGPSDTSTIGHGTSLVIEFIFEAFPAPDTFTLTKDGSTIPATSHVQLNSLTTAVYLNIADAQFSDAGIYTLEATNSVGSSSREFTLVISGKILIHRKASGMYAFNISFFTGSSSRNHIITHKHCDYS